MTPDEQLFHGGVGNLWPGSTIRPNMAEHRYVNGCPHCESQRHGSPMAIDPATPDGWVYATADLPYARYYASRAVKGWLYLVELADDAEPSEEDVHFPSWRASSARVVKVLEKRITLTMDERRALWIRWGGTDGEFNSMLLSMGASGR